MSDSASVGLPHGQFLVFDEDGSGGERMDAPFAHDERAVDAQEFLFRQPLLDVFHATQADHGSAGSLAVDLDVVAQAFDVFDFLQRDAEDAVV